MSIDFVVAFVHPGVIREFFSQDQDGGEPLAAMKTFVKGHALLELALVAVPLLVRHLSGPDVALLEQCGQVLRLCLQTHTG